MANRFFLLAASLAFVPGALIGCGQDTQPLTAPTVRLAMIAGADHGGRPFSTSMTQEVTTTPVWFGDADGAGEALITLNVGQGELCWQLSVSDIALPATAAHIHQAAPGVRGPIMIGLSAPDASGLAVGCKSGLDRDLLLEILTSPESFYVNVHTTEYPAGAVRGQLPG